MLGHRLLHKSGQPPQWTPLKDARRLPEDSGNYYRDPNAARYPEYPVAPAVKAIVKSTSDTPVDADLFACGSTLGNLLRFARGIDKAFRFSIEVIGDTVFFIRKENDPKELIEGVRGFGHSFPDAYTTWPEQVKGSETHQRIVQYYLGGVQCLVRFECDGFLDDSTQTSNTQYSTAKVLSTLPSEDALSQALSNTAITTTQDGSTDVLSVKHAGKTVAQNSIFDLKTRSGKHKKEINMDDITPQLWIKQIPNFIVAYHDGFGLFTDIQIQDVKPRVADWEKNNANAIHRLTVLLKKLIEVAKADKTGLLEVYCTSNKALEIRRQFGEGVSALPVALHEEWAVRHFTTGLKLDEDDTRCGAFPGPIDDWLSDSPDDSDDGEKDFTACSAEDCGYCGTCTY